MSIRNILQMLFILKRKDKVKIHELAEALEISDRQVRRYKEQLDEFFDIESITGINGGYRLKNTYFPFKDVLSEKEMNSLRKMVQYYIHIDNDIEQELRNAIEKVNFNILQKENDFIECEQIIPYSRPNIKEEYYFDLRDNLYEAILNSKEVWIRYTDNNGVISERVVQPYKFIKYKSETYLLAISKEKSEFRDFKLLRILDYKVLDIVFIKDKKREKEIAAKRQNSIGIYGGEEYDIVLEIHPPMVNTICERIWVDNQTINEMEGGAIIFKAKMKGGPELISWILTMGAAVKILEPQSLREEVKRVVEEMLKNL